MQTFSIHHPILATLKGKENASQFCKTIYRHEKTRGHAVTDRGNFLGLRKFSAWSSEFYVLYVETTEKIELD